MSGSLSLDDDWTPQDEFDRIKWGWNVETGEAVVWTVAGGADGRPGHSEYLEERWGRPPSVEDGDVLGVAYLVVLEGTDRLNKIAVEAFYDCEVPAAVVAALSAAYPGVTITVAP
jgi:hypothetical protein